MIGRPRAAVTGLAPYRPGKDAKQAEQDHGIADAIKLASNETPWWPIPAVVTAITEAAVDVNRYADHRATRLRAALADFLAVDSSSVTVGAGSAGLLQQLCLTYVDPGDEVLFPWRSFEAYPLFTQLAGGTAVTVPLDGYDIDLDAVAEALTERTKLVLLATPNNPTGTSLSTTDLNRFMERVDTRTIVVIDEAYREFNDDAYGDPVRNVLAEHPHAIVLRTFSKAYGLAGLRVGYGIAIPEVIETIDKTLVPFAVNGIAQVAALAALEARDEVADRAAVLLSERDRVVAELRSRGHVLSEPQGNFVWLPFGSGTDQVALALERQGVVVRPFSDDGIRVTIGTPDENDRFLEALEDPAGEG